MLGRIEIGIRENYRKVYSIFGGNLREAVTTLREDEKRDGID
jgi:hypothetical protein